MYNMSKQKAAADAIVLFTSLETYGLTPQNKKKQIGALQEYIYDLERKVKDFYDGNCLCSHYDHDCCVCSARLNKAKKEQGRQNAVKAQN